ncbi:MAG: hypothetical protein HY717_18385, partial [Planctomycetes bacterium]|nr:hypothetical protein [Planctomycetota bacterium]
MNCYVGIDLGSTTTKAVILDENGAVVGRGITNSRSNYDVACQIALTEALINARFWMVASELDRTGIGEWRRQGLLAALERNFRKQQYLDQLLILGKVLRGLSSKCSLSQIIVGSGRAILATGKARPRRRYGTEYRRAGATPPGDESAGITLQGFKKDGT